MATIYYPSNATIYTRNVSGSSLIEQNIGIAPDQIFVFSGSTNFTASLSASWSSQSLSSSFALNAAALITGSVVPITASAARTSSYMSGSNFVIKNNQLMLLGNDGHFYSLSIYVDPPLTGSLQVDFAF